MHKDWRKGTAGRVYSVSSGASEPVQIMAQDAITLPNGMAWDLARKVMFFADTGASAIFACVLGS
jgi:sugar lactone lactonase YvrE